MPVGAGRPKGSKNKAPEVQKILKKVGYDPIEGLARLANGEVFDCPVCDTDGLVRNPATGGQKACPYCMGTKKIMADAKLRVDASKELAQYVNAKRKAMEVSGPDGGPQEMVIRWGE